MQLANITVKCFQIVSTTHLDSNFSVNPYYILEEVFSKGFEPTLNAAYCTMHLYKLRGKLRNEQQLLLYLIARYAEPTTFV